MLCKKITKSLFIFIFLLCSLSFTGCGDNTINNHQGQNGWKPTKPITIICGYGVGGSTDIFARTLAKHLSKHWNIDITVKNIQGASGAIATSQFYKYPPDGYTVMISNGATVTQSAMGNMQWTYNDFTNIAKIIDEDEILCVNSNSDVFNLIDLINKCKANDGQLSIGVAGVGGYTYLAAMKFLDDLGLNVKVITYDSGAEAVSAVMGGFVDFCMQQPAEVISGIEANKLRPLAIMSDKRHNHLKLKYIPTAKEQNINFISYQWRGISAPGKLPQNIRTEWEEVLKAVCEKEDFDSDVNNILFARENILIGDDMQVFLDNEYSWIEPLIQKLGLNNNE